MSMWRPLWAALAIVTAVPAAVIGQTLAEIIGQPVVNVRFEQEGRPEDSPTLTGLSAVRVGEPLRQEDVRATIARLDGLNRYDDVSARAALVPGGVELVFVLTPRHPITALEITGNTGISAGALRRLLLQRYGGVPTGARVTAVEATAVEMLRDEGFLDARVASQVALSHDPDMATLTLDVAAGPPALVRDVTVRGTGPIAAAEVVRRSRTAAGEPFRRRQIEAALADLEEDLRGRGYYEAQLTMQATPGPEGVDVVIGMDVGPRVEVRVVPPGALPGRIDDLIPLRQAGSADQDLLEDSRARIERALRADGYWKAQAPFTRTVEQGGELVTITFNVERGPRYYVEGIELPSSQSLPASELQKLIGIGRGDLFDEDAFLAGLARVVDAYRRAGYYAVRAEPAYEERPGASPGRATVTLHPMITEGPAGVLTAVNFIVSGAAQVPEGTVAGVMTSGVGQPYVELDAARDQAAIRSLYLDLGFPSASVAVEPVFAEDGRSVILNIHINEGTPVYIGDITVVGNERVSTRAILDEMRLTPGQPAGTTALDDARRRLVEMGVFRRITISMADRAPGESSGHLIVNVVEAPATTLDWGGGIEGSRYTRDFTNRIELAPRGFIGLSRRGLGGRNRTVSFFSRVSLRRDGAEPIAPALGEDDEEHDDGRGFGFTEYRVAGTYQERHAFRSETDLLLGVASERGRRTNFDFERRRLNAEALRQFSRRVAMSGRYSLEFTRLFEEQIDESDRPLIDRLFPQVRLSILSTGLAWDRRDNVLDPASGTFVTGDFEMAARAIGSEVGYVKGIIQAAAFRGLDRDARTVLAGRAMVGAARGFPRVVEVDDLFGEQIVEDLPASQRFFAGGASTVRGFQLDRLGVEEILTADGFSRGGNGLVILNVELRRIVTRLFGRDLGAVAFVDSGNVFGRASDIRLGRLRVAPGFGVRYDSPLGPLRLDFGFKVNPKTFDGRRENGWEYHLSIGEAF